MDKKSPRRRLVLILLAVMTTAAWGLTEPTQQAVAVCDCQICSGRECAEDPDDLHQQCVEAGDWLPCMTQTCKADVPCGTIEN